MIKKIFKWITVGVAVLVVMGVMDFFIWRSQQVVRLESNSRLAHTSKGVVEYVVVGDGPAVLVLHGTLGGYDQAQILTQTLGVLDKKFIFVSRPGYLRTPLSTGATFEEQADAYAALLDELGMERVAVIAVSGGGPSALQFALRYPDRCWGMILAAANSDVNAGKENEVEAHEAEQPSALLSDIIFSDLMSWGIVRVSQAMPEKALAAAVGEDYVEVVRDDPDKYKAFAEFLNSMALLSRRREGTLNDGRQFASFTGHPFEKITVPTLILHGSKDDFAPLAQQVYLSETLPNSEYIEIEGGTHFMMISHSDVIAPLIVDFLNKYAPAK